MQFLLLGDKKLKIKPRKNGFLYIYIYLKHFKIFSFGAKIANKNRNLK